MFGAPEMLRGMAPYDAPCRVFNRGNIEIMENKMETTIMENQMEKKMENEMETRSYSVPSPPARVPPLTHARTYQAKPTQARHLISG